jgi:hypothetical protein
MAPPTGQWVCGSSPREAVTLQVDMPAREMDMKADRRMVLREAREHSEEFVTLRPESRMLRATGGAGAAPNDEAAVARESARAAATS